MSPKELNPKQEIVVAAVLSGKTYREAAEEAGFTEDHVKQLLRPGSRHPEVLEEYQRRKVELGEALAVETRRSLEGLLSELEEATEKAKRMLEFPSWIRAIMARAKLLGLFVDKKQIDGSITVRPAPRYDWDKMPLEERIKIAEKLDSIKLIGGEE